MVNIGLVINIMIALCAPKIGCTLIYPVEVFVVSLYMTSNFVAYGS